MPNTWLVTFDVSGSRNRRVVERLLERYGVRVLYSVYEVQASTTQMDRLLEQVGGHVRDQDHLLALPHCPDCHVVEHGPTIEPTGTSGWVTG